MSDHVFPRLTAEIEARNERGMATYGRPLTTGNGRFALRDALDEALDLAVYLTQMLMELESGRPVRFTIGDREFVMTAREVGP